MLMKRASDIPLILFTIFVSLLLFLLDDNPEGQKQFGDTLRDALSGLAKNTEGLQVCTHGDQLSLFCKTGSDT